MHYWLDGDQKEPRLCLWTHRQNSCGRKYVKKETGLDLSWDSTRKRTTRYRDLYFETSKWANSTGAGVPEKSSAQNLDEYLELVCPHYARMNSLFWNSPHKEPHGELGTEFGGVVTFNSRKTKYTVNSLSAGEDGGGSTAPVIPSESEQEDTLGDQPDEEYVESWLGSEGNPGEYDDLDYNNGQGDQAQDSQATMPFQGPAFTEFRTPHFRRSESDLTTTKSNTSSKRRHSADRSETLKGSSKSLVVNPRQGPVIDVDSHPPPHDGKLPMEVLQSYNVRTEGNMLFIFASLLFPCLFLSRQFSNNSLFFACSPVTLKLQKEKIEYEWRLEQDKLKLEHEKVNLERERVRVNQENHKLEQRRMFMETLVGKVSVEDASRFLALLESPLVITPAAASSEASTTPISGASMTAATTET
jgi:hypothetical protein